MWSFPHTLGQQISDNLDKCPCTRGKLLIDALRVLEFLYHFLGFIIATGPVAPRANHGNNPAGSNSLFDALPHEQMDQRSEWFSQRLGFFLSLMFVAFFLKTPANKTRSMKQGHIREAGQVLTFASRLSLSSPAVVSWLKQLVLPWIATRGLISLSQLAQTASFKMLVSLFALFRIQVHFLNTN